MTEISEEKLNKVFSEYNTAIESLFHSVKSPMPVEIRSMEIPKKKRREFLRLPRKEDVASNLAEEISFAEDGSCLCAHKNIVKNGTVKACEDCGLELDIEISYEQDWRYYGENDSKNSSDPARCQYRKSPEKGIKKELEQIGFPREICEISDDKYMMVTRGEIKRSNLRKGIMFACVFETYKEKGEHRVPDELQSKFGIDRKSMSKGNTYYRTRCPKEMLSDESITAEHFIPYIMKKFRAKKEHIDKVVQIYEKVKGKSIIFNRSNPQSTSTGIVYYYLRRYKCDISSAKFSKIVKLGEGIVVKIAKEVSRLLDTLQTVDLD